MKIEFRPLLRYKERKFQAYLKDVNVKGNKKITKAYIKEVR